ncbi:MAG: hypothetical protein ACI935_001424 [Moritella dasanensis]|jgi:hypothetical protein
MEFILEDVTHNKLDLTRISFQVTDKAWGVGC